MIIFGTYMCGKVDQVPGLFYVATQFVHIQFVPLVPIGSYLVFDDPRNRGGNNGFKIGLSAKSLLVGWLRAGSVVGGAVAALFTLLTALNAVEGKDTWLSPLILAGLAATLFYVFYASYRWSQAGAERALLLAAKAGYPVEVVAQHFGLTEEIPTVEPVAEYPD